MTMKSAFCRLTLCKNLLLQHSSTFIAPVKIKMEPKYVLTCEKKSSFTRGQIVTLITVAGK